MVEVKNWKNIEGKVFNEKAQRQEDQELADAAVELLKL